MGLSLDSAAQSILAENGPTAMATEKQFEANRNNAKLSTGPTTERSKSLTRMNALKSGAYARSRLLPGEDTKQYEALARSTFETCSPVGPIESAVTQRLIDCMWRLGRLAQAEHAALLRSEIKDQLNTDAGPSRYFLANQRDVETTLKARLGAELIALEYIKWAENENREPVCDSGGTSAGVSDLGGLPVAFTFLESYGYAKANPLCAEIDRHVSSTTKELLRLQAALAAMQQGREIVVGKALEVQQSISR